MRRAFVCQHKDCVPPRRFFLTPEVPKGYVPVCHERRMVPQPNQKYHSLQR